MADVILGKKYEKDERKKENVKEKKGKAKDKGKIEVKHGTINAKGEQTKPKRCGGGARSKFWPITRGGKHHLWRRGRNTRLLK
jgi:hypothetical protein